MEYHDIMSKYNYEKDKIQIITQKNILKIDDFFYEMFILGSTREKIF